MTSTPPPRPARTTPADTTPPPPSRRFAADAREAWRASIPTVAEGANPSKLRRDLANDSRRSSRFGRIFTR